MRKYALRLGLAAFVGVLALGASSSEAQPNRNSCESYLHKADAKRHQADAAKNLYQTLLDNHGKGKTAPGNTSHVMRSAAKRAKKLQAEAWKLETQFKKCLQQKPQPPKKKHPKKKRGK